jgi:hypothetical protein
MVMDRGSVVFDSVGSGALSLASGGGRLAMGDAMAHDALGMIEFSNKPAVLVLADSEASGERARRSAERAGCRVSDVVFLEAALGRLARQALVDAAFVEVEQDEGAPLDALLDALDETARAGGHGSVVSAPAGMIDQIAARTLHPRVIHLCEASEEERVAALAEVAAPQRHRLHDIGRDDAPPKLRQLSEEVGRIADILATLSEEARTEPPPLQEEEGEDSPISAGAVRAIIRARRLRDQYLGSELFADPAWDMMLDLFAAKLEQRRVAVSSLCIAAAVPPTTALRWIKTLTDVGVLVRAADPQDGRRVYIELSAKAAAGMDAYLKAAQRVSPLTL